MKNLSTPDLSIGSRFSIALTELTLKSGMNRLSRHPIEGIIGRFFEIIGK